MERAGGSDNTLQIIAHPRSPLSSYSLTPPPSSSVFLPFNFSPTSSVFLSLTLSLFIVCIFHSAISIFLAVLSLGDDSESHKASLTADVAMVCERSVLSKQTHWAICYSTLHQAGSSEESAHHFNQPRRHTMNL